MQLHFTGRNVEITPALKKFTTEKFERLEKRLDDTTIIHLVFHVEHVKHTAEATLHLHAAELHASADADDMYTAIDLLIDKLIAQINKHKEKHKDHR